MLGPPLPPNPGLPGFGTMVRKSGKPDLRWERSAARAEHSEEMAAG
jgi:hypothetical protein